MSNQTIQNSTATFPIWLFLTIALLVAKLTGYLHIGWWIVFLPLWAPLAFYFAVFLIVAVVGTAFVLLREVFKR